MNGSTRRILENVAQAAATEERENRERLAKRLAELARGTRTVGDKPLTYNPFRALNPARFARLTQGRAH